MKVKVTDSPVMWLAWLLVSGALITMLAWKLNSNPKDMDQTVFMPGPLTDGHHQLADNCGVCHTEPLGGKEIIQQACVDCHGEDRKKPMDSHPRTKFTDPRNADTLENIDALHCVTCHTEHKPEITLTNGLTQPQDICMHCHKDIGEDRPSHKGMDFMTCKTAGCHNFHNNRSLYTDFLIKHLQEPELLEKKKLPSKEFAQVLEEIIEYPRDRYPIEPLTDIKDADAPAEKISHKVSNEWLETAHASSGVNCTACHVYQENSEAPGEAVWRDKPGPEGCASCHNLEVERFKRGRHGMRLSAGLPAMKVSDARLVMKKDRQHESVGCNSCHAAHRFDSRKAAVKACLTCHDDEHSLAYEQSPHAQLWVKELSGDLADGEGVSCASCHMPRLNYDVNEWMSRIMVDHNQNANLTPNSKMIRSVCMHCHGLEFSINALGDRQLVRNNFNGRPQFATESMRLAEADLKRAEAELKSAGLEE